MFNKLRNYAGLLSIMDLNTNAITRESYNGFYGDKETFWIGLELTNSPYAIIHHNVLTMGAFVDVTDKADKVGLCGAQIGHLDEFNQLSWMNGGWLENKQDHQSKVAKITHYVQEVEPLYYRWPNPAFNHHCLQVGGTRNKVVELSDSEKAI